MNPQEVPSVEVTYSAADIATLNIVIWRWWMMLIGILAAFLILVPIILALLDGYPLRETLAAIDWEFTGIILSCLVVWILLVSVFRYWLRRRAGLHGPIKFKLSEKGVTFRNREMDGAVFWTALKSIKQRNGRLFIFLTRRTAFVIPRSAFQSDVEFETFANAAREGWNQRHRL